VEFNSDQTPAEIISSDLEPLDLLDLKRALTPTRRHGLAAVSSAIRAFAQSQMHLSSPNDRKTP
jgi:sulfur transfer protein SufE